MEILTNIFKKGFPLCLILITVRLFSVTPVCIEPNESESDFKASVSQFEYAEDTYEAPTHITNEWEETDNEAIACISTEVNRIREVHLTANKIKNTRSQKTTEILIFHTNLPPPLSFI